LEAAQAGHTNASIPVYTIGLSIVQSPSPFNTTQGNVLGDNATQDCNFGETSGPGVAYVTKGKAFFVPVGATPSDTENALNGAFEQIAKSLVILQQN
jgi:hypothetical protein